MTGGRDWRGESNKLETLDYFKNTRKLMKATSFEGIIKCFLMTELERKF